MRASLLTLTACLFVLPASAKYSGGTGEPNDPYQIATAEDLMLLGDSPDDYDKHFILTADIDLDPNLPGHKVFDKAVIAPDADPTEYSGFQGTRFNGVFDGSGHTISHLTIKGKDYLGLLGRLVSGGEVKDLGMVDVDIAGSGTYVGGLVGLSYGVVTQCYSTGAVSGDGAVGGLVGFNDDGGTVTQCYSTGGVSGNQELGGLVGSNKGTVTQCHATNAARGNWDVGGLVGDNYHSGTVTQCYSTGTIRGDRDVGGLVGDNWGTVIRCYGTGAVRGTGDFLGGLVGRNLGVVTKCCSSGTARGDGAVGGLVGYNAGPVTQCYSSGAVSSNHYVGGLVGSNSGNVAQCYSTGRVNGPDGAYVGGLVGSNFDAVTQCYSTGVVSGTGSYIGGLVGGNSGSVTNCCWDIQTSGQATSATGIGKTTGEMQTAKTFLDAAWDFVGETPNGTSEIWRMPEGGGYPILAFFKGYTPPQLQGCGTSEDPYLISSAMELGAMVHYSPCAYYRLAASIDLSGLRWGMAVIPLFAGTFDGNGHVISHLTIDGGSYLGLFGQLAWNAAAEVKDLEVVDVNITGSGFNVGGLVGSNNNELYIGGASLTRCRAAGAVRGSRYVGGLVGWNHRGALTQCHSTGVVGGDSYVGGLVGCDEDALTGCQSTATASGTGYSVGGLVGDNYYSGTVTQCYSMGTIRGDRDVGGLVGDNSGGVTDCYSVGAVSGNDDVGGLVGVNSGSVTDCYSTGLVSGSGQYIGGLVGCPWVLDEDQFWPVEMRGSMTNCFWDTETSGQATSDGGTGKTTAEMRTARTFLDAGWDFVGETANGTEDIWWILEGKDYPRLWWETTPE